MEEFENQLIALGVTVGTVLVGYIVAWIRSKIVNGKLSKLEPIMTKLEEELPKYFLPVLQNVYQKYIKPIYKKEEWTTEKKSEVFEIAFSEVKKTLPDFLIKMLKQVKSNWEEMLRARLQAFLELNKSKANANTPTNGISTEVQTTNLN